MTFVLSKLFPLFFKREIVLLTMWSPATIKRLVVPGFNISIPMAASDTKSYWQGAKVAHFISDYINHFPSEIPELAHLPAKPHLL